MRKTGSSSISEDEERGAVAVGKLAIRRLAEEVRACRICLDAPQGRPLPHAPRPVFRISDSARIAVFGQAPGTRVHASGRPFTDPSGVRLRHWMGVSEAEFYDLTRVAVLPMGFCFPGQDTKGADLPPRRECAAAWRARLLASMPQLQLGLLVGSYAQAWHLPAEMTGGGLTATVAAWREILAAPLQPRMLPLPHPSWRNNSWLRTNAWFESELVPRLRREIRALIV